MEIVWAEFTPATSSAGGVMIGLAALFFMLLNVCIIGMSGILLKGNGHNFVMKHNRPIFGARFDLPSCNNIERPLLIGSAIFGISWGLAGFRQGPVVASLLFQPVDMLPFLVTLLAAAFIGRWFRSWGYKE